MEHGYVSWTDYGPIIVQSRNQVEERKDQNQTSSTLEHNHSYVNEPDLDQDSDSDEPQRLVFQIKLPFQQK